MPLWKIVTVVAMARPSKTVVPDFDDVIAGRGIHARQAHGRAAHGVNRAEARAGAIRDSLKVLATQGVDAASALGAVALSYLWNHVALHLLTRTEWCVDGVNIRHCHIYSQEAMPYFV
ncbi:hypothetical protein CO2235_90231 [Cupriavidus oxalaticus]|uniref:Uncharacterized protein n=1 Tax=Cupriavidus oxalaticus TaxID=96344 RepID=A0A976GBN4_9BURK|nr:hypothetical protein CO2235_90231 [Cupriavidus oxalaticus]